MTFGGRSYCSPSLYGLAALSSCPVVFGSLSDNAFVRGRLCLCQSVASVFAAS
ncbi:hypothetical protein AALP_AA3G256300 [Arabis alpina]|uniref:Uncharacterized protein n=1 Tax=Arabis alpina TaxID=50452 RepID=A0A087HBM8_ARAAL|nr:hypothetical protein AALP_AA3G256300 [Arabis alpina]